jgi:DNA-binding transcriptional LysR family regulator
MATSALFHVLPQLLDRVKARLPGVSMTITDMNSDEQVRSLTVDRIDLGFIHARPDIRGLARCNVVTDSPSPWRCPQPMRWRGRTGLALRDLQDEPWWPSRATMPRRCSTR